MPFNTFNKVDLPAPLRPVRPILSLSLIKNEMPPNITRPLKWSSILETAIIEGAKITRLPVSPKGSRNIFPLWFCDLSFCFTFALKIYTYVKSYCWNFYADRHHDDRLLPVHFGKLVIYSEL